MANIILDYDGTIHDCAKIYVPAFYTGYKYLTDRGLAPVHEYSYNEVSGYLGYSVNEMWNRFLPELERSHRDKCGKIISEEMLKMIADGKSVLYSGAEKALQELKSSGHALIFLSNCMHDYMEAHRKVHCLDRFYSGYYCTEDFGFISKPEIFTHIQQKYDGEFIIVGDRFLDLETAKKFSLKSIGCNYGYGEKGELDSADITVESITEIPNAVESILKKDSRTK